MQVTPFIIGSGRSADAVKKSFLLLGMQDPELQIQPPIQLSRGEIPESVSGIENPLLVVSNPHGLHAQSILDGERAGFKAILVEKPACVSLREIDLLRAVRIPVAVCHVYRQMWGLQSIKKMLDSGELGELICIEGRYWQSSTAQRALDPVSTANAWKNDALLSGNSDTLIDVGVHWMDAVSFLMGEMKFIGTAWLSYKNAESPHRDSHVHLSLDYSGGRRAMGSVSKTFHGATNHFEVNVVGSKKSATWQFLEPDEIVLGSGNSRQIFARKETQLGLRQPPFHGAGWLEGYVETVRQLVLELKGSSEGNYPKLSDNIRMLESLFQLKVIKQGA